MSFTEEGNVQGQVNW